MSDVPTWYDLLDVDRDATTDEIRAAWKAQIADLEPGDRRFDALNRAAKVLLDADARSSYDAQHPVEPPLVEEGALAPAPSLVEEGALAPAPSLVEEGALAPVSKPSSGGVPSWLLAGLAIVAAGLVAVTAWMWTSGDSGDGGSAARDAQVDRKSVV